MFARFQLLSLAITLLLLFACNCEEEQEDIAMCQSAEVGDTFFIYEDFEIPSPPLWTPDGWMPDGLGIQYNDAHTDNTYSGPNCIEIIVSMNDLAEKWAGIYWLANQSWEGPGINLLDEFCLEESNSVILKFQVHGAIGTEKVRFFVGGVTDGNDSINPQVSSSWLNLSTNWEEIEIDLAGENLHNVVGVFGWVTAEDQNPGAAEVRFYLDNIRLEVSN